MPEFIPRIWKRNGDRSPGATLVELSVSLLLMSIVGVGLTGAVTVGIRVGAHLEARDKGLVIAHSQAEFILSQPSASSYPFLPSGASNVLVTADITDNCRDRPYLQCLKIEVFLDQTKTADGVVEAYRARRFVEVEPGVQQRVVPKSAGMERVRTSSTAPVLGPQEGFSARISKVLPSIIPTDILVRWNLRLPRPNLPPG